MTSQDETTRIIAWLRSHEGPHGKIFAAAIERGEHLDASGDEFVDVPRLLLGEHDG